MGPTVGHASSDASTPDPAAAVASHPARTDAGHTLPLRALLAVFAGIGLLLGVDALGDLAAGTGGVHVAVELAVVLLALVGVGLVLRALRARLADAREAQALISRDLHTARADAARWRSDARALVSGLSEAIDRQLESWGLTPAEKEIALLLLKGLSLKEIAAVRDTSERTARQQSLAVYRKGGLAGRAELAAFFLEDLLAPADPRVNAGETVTARDRP